MPRLFAKIFLIIFALFLIWVIIFQIHFNLKGRDLIVQRLQALTGRKVTIGALYTTFPTNIHIRNLEIRGLVKADSVYAAGGFYNIFTKHFGFVLVRVYHPSLEIMRNSDQSFAEAIGPAINLFVRNGIGNTSSSAPVFSSCYIDHLIIDNGNVTYTDTITAENGIIIRLEDLSIRVDDLNFCSLEPRVTNFEVKARIPWRGTSENGSLSCSGWVNWLKKDMQASLRVDNIDAVYISPYFSRYIDIEKAKIQSAKLQLTSDITGLNNDVNAQCRLELTNIVFKPRPPEDEPTRGEKMANTVLDIFKGADQGKVVLTFPVKTQMDNPKLGFNSIKTAVETKIMTERAKNKSGVVDVIFFPAKIVEGGIRTTTDMTKAVIGGVFSIGWELLTPFKKEKPETAPQAAKPPPGG